MTPSEAVGDWRASSGMSSSAVVSSAGRKYSAEASVTFEYIRKSAGKRWEASGKLSECISPEKIPSDQCRKH